MNQNDKNSRRQRAEALVLDHLQKQRDGIESSEDVLLAAHPALRKDIESALPKARALARAFAAADSQTSQTDAPPLDSSHPSSLSQLSDRDSATDAHRSHSSSRTVACPSCRAPIELSTIARLDGDTLESICGTCGRQVVVRRELDLDHLAHFELIARLGAGGFGTVWRAFDTKLDREVALKVASRSEAGADTEDAFLREARAAARLKHPNIVATYEFGVDGEIAFIAAELIEGVTLKELIKQRPPRPKDAAELCSTIAAAAHYAHEHGVIHRDLKPQNILLDFNDRPHIADFGLARREFNEATVTMAGQIVGTPAYMSPEQAEGDSHRTDHRSDVYSIGCMLFEMLTGELPFRGSLSSLIHQVVSAPPPRPRQLQPNIPIDLETICLKCLEKRPAARYATADALAVDLLRFVNHEPISARPIGQLGQLVRWSQRKPAVATLAALLCVTVLTGFAGVSWKWRDAEVALEQTVRAERRANNNLKSAGNIVNDFVVTVADETLLEEPGMEPLRLKLLGQAAEYYKTLAATNADDPNSRAQAADAKGRLALLQAQTGDDASIADLNDAIRQLVELLGAHDNPPAIHRMLYDLCIMKGDAQLSLAISDDATAAPLESYLQAKEHLALSDIDPKSELGIRNDASLKSILAVGYGRARHPEVEGMLLEAIGAWQSIVEQDAGDIDAKNTLAGRHSDLARIYDRTLQLAEAVDHHETAIGLMREVVDAEPTPIYLNRLAWAIKMSRYSRLNGGQETRKSIELFQEAASIHAQLMDDFPSTDRYPIVLLDDLVQLGKAYLAIEDFDAAHANFDRILSMVDSLQLKDPDNLTWQQYRLGAMHGHGFAYRKQKDDKATEFLEAVTEAAEPCCDTESGRAIYISALGQLSSIYGNAGNLESANKCFQRALAMIDQYASDRNTVQSMNERIGLRANFLVVTTEQQPAFAEKEAKLGLLDLAEMRRLSSGDFIWYAVNDATLNYWLGRALLSQQKYIDAESALTHSNQVAKDHLGKTPHFMPLFVASSRYLAELQMRTLNPSDARSYADRVIQQLQETPESLLHGVRVLDQCLRVVTNDRLLSEEARADFVDAQTEQAAKWFLQSIEDGFDIRTEAKKENFLPYLREHSAEVRQEVESVLSELP